MIETNTTLYKEDDNKTFQLLGQGNTAEIYQYGTNKVLKLFREKMPLSPIENEYNISSIIQNKIPNVPRVYGFITYRNRYGIVYEHILGKGMIQVFRQNLFHIKKYAKQYALIHQSLHNKDINLHTNVKDKLCRDIDSTSDLTIEEKMKIKQYIETLPDGTKLCHFDFHPGNIIIRNHSPIIIDWMTGCTGDPNADVARTILLMRTGEMMHINRFARTALHFIMKKIGTEYFKEYLRLTGISAHEVQQWILPVAAARLSEWLTAHERKRLLLLVRNELAHKNL